MAYDSTNKKLYVSEDKGISTSEIAACLGDYRVTARGRDIGLLCTSPKINVWAKFKPFRNSSKGFATDTAREQARSSVNYGVTPRRSTSIKALKVYYDEDMNGWSIALPRGLSYSEPFRMLDFDGYNHKCVSPFTRMALPKAAVNTYETSGFTIALPLGGGSGIEGNLQMGDFKDIKDGYLTIQLRHQNPSGTGIFIRTVSADKTIAEMDGGSIVFSTYQLPAGVWDVIPFISPVKYSGNDGNELPTSQYYVTIPKCYVGEMKIANSEYALVYFEAYKNPYLAANPVYSVSFNFAVQNNSAETHTFDNVTVQIRYPGKSFDSTLASDEAQYVIPSFAVASGENKSVAEVVNGDGVLATQWITQRIGQALYNNTAGQEILVRLGNGQPVYRLAIKSTSSNVPEYDGDTEYPEIEI